MLRMERMSLRCRYCGQIKSVHGWTEVELHMRPHTHLALIKFYESKTRAAK